MAKQLHIKEPEVDGIWGAGKYLCEIFEATAEEKLEQPTFITEYPWEVSPLARRNDNNPFITDRFEFFVVFLVQALSRTQRKTLKVT